MDTDAISRAVARREVTAERELCLLQEDLTPSTPRAFREVVDLLDCPLVSDAAHGALRDSGPRSRLAPTVACGD